MDSSRAEHKVIAEAIISQDSEETRRVMRGHVASSYMVLTDILARREI